MEIFVWELCWRKAAYNGEELIDSLQSSSTIYVHWSDKLRHKQCTGKNVFLKAIL
jgi:hypothetical protein